MRRTRPSFVLYAIRMVKERIVRVRAYKRFRNGRIERVRSHYRKY